MREKFPLPEYYAVASVSASRKRGENKVRRVGGPLTGPPPPELISSCQRQDSPDLLEMFFLRGPERCVPRLDPRGIFHPHAL